LTRAWTATQTSTCRWTCPAKSCGTRKPSPKTASRTTSAAPTQHRTRSRRWRSAARVCRRWTARRSRTTSSATTATPRATPVLSPRPGLYLHHHGSLAAKDPRSKAANKLQSSATIGGTHPARPLKITSRFEEKTKFICKFCGGPPCPLEDWTKIKRPAVAGLNSNWINDDIVASQRLGEKLIKQHDIIGQFKRLGIGAVVNLQEPGEHPYCGEPVVPEWGFSYSSEGLNNRRLPSADGISTFHLHWEDLKPVELSHLLKSARLINAEMQLGKKILVHCHAGRGRTGMIVCCMLIFRYKMSAQDSMNLFQQKREGTALTNKAQRKCIEDFEKRSRPSPVIDSLSLTFGKSSVTFDQIVAGQKKLENINSSAFANYIPKVVIEVLDTLCSLKDQGVYSSAVILNAFLACEMEGTSWTSLDEERLTQIKLDFNKRRAALSKQRDPRYLAQLLLDFFDSLAQPVISSIFMREHEDVLHSQTTMLQFINADHPKSATVSPSIYHVLCFVCKSMRSLLGKTSDQSKLANLRFVLLRLSISLRQAKVDHVLFARNVILHKDFMELASTDKLTELLFCWVSNYDDHSKELFQLLSSPMPTLQKKILEHNGSSSYGKVDKFDSKSLQKSSTMTHKEKQMKIDLLKIGAPQITEEEDGPLSPMSELDLDSLPDDIKNYLPIFRSLSYEEQNQLIKHLNSILQST